jgi:glycosyltransferase involved in cell wall biosynthesis
MHRMAGSLARHGYKVQIICLGDKQKNSDISSSEDGFVITRINLMTDKLPSFFKIIKYIEFIFRCKILIGQFKTDIIHCHDFDTLPVGMVARKKRFILYDSHELETHRNGVSKSTSFIVGLFEKLFIKKTDACITVNEEIAKILSDKYSVRVDSIYNAYSPEEIIVDPDNSIRKLINAGDDHFVVIYPGVISYGRGLSKILEAASDINKNIIFVFFGDGSYKQKLKNHICQLDLKTRVFVFDPVPFETVFQYMATSDLGIMPTLDTSLSYKLELGNKFFQYIAAGIPVASSDQPVKAKLIKRYNIGIIFDAENPKDIAKKLNKLFADKTKLSDLRENVRKAQKELCWQVEEEKLLKIYGNL